MGEGSVGDAEARPRITLAELERWIENGADWRALEVADELAVIELRTCYGEPVDTVRSTDPGLIEYVRTHHPV